MRVDLLGQQDDALAQFGRQAGVVVGEGEGFKTAGFVVARAVFQRTTCGQRPLGVQLAGKNAQGVGIVQSDNDQHLIRQDCAIQKLKNPVFGRHHGGDVAR